MPSPPDSHPDQTQHLRDRCAELSASLGQTTQAQQALEAPSQAIRTQTLPALELWRTHLRSAFTSEHWRSYRRQILDARAAARALHRSHPRVLWIRSQNRRMRLAGVAILLVRWLPTILTSATVVALAVLVYLYGDQVLSFFADLFTPPST